MKKSIAMLLALLLAFPVIMPGIIPAHASDDITITNVSHSVSAGNANYNVTLQSASDGAAPAVAIVHYEDDVLTAFDVEKCVLSSGVATPVNVSIPVSVTDSTRVAGFVLDSMSSAIPLRIDEIERFGSTVNTLSEAQIDGLASGDVVVDSSAQTVSVYLPFYDSDGNAVDFSAAQMTVTLDHAKAQASLVDAGIQFTGDGAVKTAVVDLGYTDTLRITSEEGSVRDYELKIYKSFTEDFETASTIMQQNLTKYEGKGNTASKLLVATSQTNAAVGFGSGSGGGNGFYIEKTLQSASNPTFKLTPDAALNSDYHSMEFDMKFEYVGGDKPTTYLAGYIVPKANGKKTFGLLGSDTSKDAYDNGTAPTLGICRTESGSTAGTGISDMDEWHRIKVDFSLQANGKIIPRLWNGTNEITVATISWSPYNLNVSDLYFDTSMPTSHTFWVEGARTIRVCIDNIKFTQSVCNKRTPSSVTPPAISGADYLSFTPSINNGVISIDGRSKYGNVSAMVSKAGSDGSAADFEALSDGALVLLDAKVTNNDGSFDFTNESAGLAAGWYSFAVNGTGIAAPVVHTIYYASPEEMTEALGAINTADAVALPSKLAQYENALQIASLLDDPVYAAYSAAVAKDIVAQRQNGSFTKDTLASALSLAIGAQAVANANSQTIDAALSAYGSALGLDTAGFAGLKAATMRCFAGLKGEYYTNGKTPAVNNIDEFFDKVIALAKVNTASRDTIMGVITNNYSSLGIDTSSLTNINDKNVVGKRIVVTEQSKEYMTISALSDAFDRAVASLGSGGSQGGSRPSSPSTPIISTGNTTSEIQISGEVTTEAPVFNDIQLAPWAEEYIICLAENGIVSGKGNGKFDPMGYVTREEFAKMLTMAVNSDGSTDVSFTDVDPNAWYAPYIANAVAAGLVAGYEDGSFGIGKSISRQEAAVMIARAATIIRAQLPRGHHNFADSLSIASWAEEAVGQCVALGIISGNNNNEFLPDNSITRAECAKMIYCLIRTE